MAMLRVHLLQNWFGYSDPAMEEALYETTILRQFAGLSLERIPDETTILNFRRLLERHELAAGILAVINGYLGDRGLSLRQGTIVDATLIRKRSINPVLADGVYGALTFYSLAALVALSGLSGLVRGSLACAVRLWPRGRAGSVDAGDHRLFKGRSRS